MEKKTLSTGWLPGASKISNNGENIETNNLISSCDPGLSTPPLSSLPTPLPIHTKFQSSLPIAVAFVWGFYKGLAMVFFISKLKLFLKLI